MPRTSAPDTSIASLRKLLALDATIVTVASIGMFAGFIATYWHTAWSGSLIPALVIMIILVSLLFAWADAKTTPRLDRRDSAGVHYTRRGAVEVPNL